MANTPAILKVCIPNTNFDYFDYFALDKMPAIGARVIVPFGKKTRLGVVVGHERCASTNAPIKTIIEVLDEKAIIPKDLLELCQWVAQYYQAPMSAVVALAMPKNLRENKKLSVKVPFAVELILPLAAAKSALRNSAKRQHELVDFIDKGGLLSKKDILGAGFSSNILQGLIDKEIVRLREISPSIEHKNLEKPHELNLEQATAVETIVASMNTYRCFLLKGITGSGKTEIYLQVIQRVLAEDKQVLILVPEIGLTPQLLTRFSNRFNDEMAVIHSNLSDSERHQAWDMAYNNKAKIIIGTRGAIFTPMPKLGLIVIDEEHDSSLKQMDRVRYSARDSALVRASRQNIPIILGSATPSLESLHNVECGKYQMLTLTKSALSKESRRYQLVDLRSVHLNNGLAPITIKTIGEHLANNNQVLIFINRRGFSPVLLCHTCGWIADCKHCDSHLTLHRKKNQLVCHHCGAYKAIPKVCGQGHKDSLLPIGMGTQRVEEVLKDEFLQCKIVRIDRDSMQKKNALAEHLSLIKSGDAQIIIGTQMMAKGHHFPNLTLVVVLDADVGFYNQDFRATEALGQLLTQVAGRAGRAQKQGHIIIQTHVPDHPLLNVLVRQGYDDFAREILIARKKACLPPFNFLVVIRADGRNTEKVLSFLNTVKNMLQHEAFTIMGPAPAPLSRKAGFHRMQLIINSSSRGALQNSLTALRKKIILLKLASAVRFSIDVDPLDLS